MLDTIRDWMENVGIGAGLLFAVVAYPFGIYHFFYVGSGTFAEDFQKCGISVPGPLAVPLMLGFAFAPILIVFGQALVTEHRFGEWTEIGRRVFIGVLMGVVFGYEIWLHVAYSAAQDWGWTAHHRDTHFYESDFCAFTRGILPDVPRTR